MPLCKKHAVCVSEGVYSSKTIAEILCQLSECNSDGNLEQAEILWYSSLEEIETAESDERRKEATERLLCLLSVMPEMEDRGHFCKKLFDLCQQGNIKLKYLCAALVARSEMNTLTSFLDFGRPFLRCEENVGAEFCLMQDDVFMELFLITVRKQQHWLVFLLDKLSSLLQCKNLENVENILSHPVLQIFWPLLLVEMLQSDSGVALCKFLADHTVKYKDSYPTIQKLAEKISWYSKVVLWMRENGVIHHTSTEHYFQSYSTLNLLNNCCNITELDWDQTHNFLLKHSHDEGCVSTGEVALYDAFSACVLSFEYILDCLHSKHTKVEQASKSLTTKLTKLQIILCQLQPLALRLKVMEKIFSLLFLQYNDFQEEICSDSEEGEIDTNHSFLFDEGDLASKHLHILSSSMSSLTNIVSQNQDLKCKLKAPTRNSIGQAPAENRTWHEYNQKHGFVCDRYMTRDILNLLKRCLKKVDDSEDNSLLDEDIARFKHTFESDEEQVEQRFIALQNKVSMAHWKLEILLGSEFIQQSGTPVTVEKLRLPKWIFLHCFDDDSGSDEEPPCLTQSNKGPRLADAEKSSESGSPSNVASQGLNLKGYRKGRRRSSVRHRSKHTKDTIINRMLSSNQSLVSQCLSRNNVSAARNVVQALKLEDHEISTEVNFNEAYRNLRLKVLSCAEEANRQLKQEFNPKSAKSTLQAIQRAASAGVQASSLNKEVEKFLSCQPLPRIVDIENVPKEFLQLFGGSSEEQPVVSAAVDIALVLSSSVRQAASFLNTVSKYSHELRNIQVTAPTRSRPIGFLPLLQNILQATLSEKSSPCELFHRWDVPNFISRGLRDTLQFWEKLLKLQTEIQSSNNYVVMYPRYLHLMSCNPLMRGLDNKQDFNYLQDFKLYLKLLKGCQERSTAPSADLPLVEEHFALLQRSPFKLLAHMVLEEGMLPQSLESIASHLNFNLPHIISCELCTSLPSVPSAGLSPNVSSAGLWRGVQVLNTSDVIGPARQPVKAAETLLKLVVRGLCHQLSIKQKLHQSPSDGCLLVSQVNVEQTQLILAVTWELQDLDLKLLQPGAETLVFFCNLANLMWIHTIIYLSNMKNYGGKLVGYLDFGDFDGSRFLSTQTFWKSFHNGYVDPLGLWERSPSRFPQNEIQEALKSLVGGNAAQQLAVMNSFAYQVGTAGILTLWEVRRLALGINMMKPLGTRALLEYAMATDSFDPLSLFVVSTGTKLSPKLKVLYPDNLEEQLQQSVQDYVHHWANVENGRVTVPWLVQQYIQSTGQNMQVFLRSHIMELSEEKTSNCNEFQVSYMLDDFMPSIVLDYGEKTLEEVSATYPISNDWKSNGNLLSTVLQYIKSYSPVVHFLLEELLQKVSPIGGNSDSDEEALEATETSFISSLHPSTIEQYPSLDRLCKRFDTSAICQLFNSNTLLCALHSVVPPQLLWEGINSLMEEQKWEAVVDLLHSLPTHQLLGDPVLTVLQDLALMELAIEHRGTDQSWLFCEQISSLCHQVRFVEAESTYWSGEICLAQMKKILQKPELKYYPMLYSKVEKLMQSIKIYQNIADCKGSPFTWQEVRSNSQICPPYVFKVILYNQKADICLSWMDLHNIVTTHPGLVDSKVVVLLLNDEQERLLDVERLLRALPANRAAEICLTALEGLCKLTSVQFCVNFLTLHCIDELTTDDRSSLETITLGIQMVKAVPTAVQSECIELVRNPHLMIEQMVMNVQFEAAEKMLNSVRPQLLKLSSKSPLSVFALDSVIRQYAEKALEFQISQDSATSEMSETSVLSSFSSHSGSKDIQMPSKVPSKAEWVPNEKATVCMECQLSTFTMFNRRHHCRRCGRVICAQCSPHKVSISDYGTLKVRVCNSCHSKISEMDVRQAFDQQNTVPSESNASLPSENSWRLSNYPSNNDAIRGEFAYEHAPSVSMCLSILKLHSESAACPNFLVDSCDTILSYLQPQGGMPNPEVDYGFVIEMCRSLVLAAKVKCAQWGYVSGEPNCDQRLSKIDLLGLLVSHGCTSLILDETDETSRHGLRRLQTQLIEAELWELALEISTKRGMEKIVVWTSWGKSCLRAGRWKEARDKFSYCFPVSSRVIRSAPDSPLLLDILQILESTPHSFDQTVLCNAEVVYSPDNWLARTPALVILNSLASLKNISQGKFPQMQGAVGSLQPFIYSECCYYLREYGSHASYLRFLVRHCDFVASANHTISHSIDPLIFFESVYMPCLRGGQITHLHSAMTAIDPSLSKWTTYLHGICAALERRKLLHTLYELQQWSKDHVRAAMTCIRFYHLNAKSYSQLAGNINHLMRAQSHLEGALAVASVSESSNKSMSEDKMEGSESMWLQLTPKEIDHHMSTVERQKELTKFLSAYEADGHSLYEAARWFPHAFAEPLAHGLPTLFGSTFARKLLTGLCLYCGKNVEEGYGTVYRIIENFNLPAYDIYEAVAIALFRSGRSAEISQLLNCIRSSGIADPSSVCDSVLLACFLEVSHQPNASEIDFLARNISDHTVKIKAFISCGQLKSAYLLAVKFERLDDVEQILLEAEKLGQEAIKKICLKRLGRM